ncbi:hypothetical protein V7S43_010626 [Phytophthora oleae]|uniref:Uncharacterized protein n=1 Tax=Phytophthora oleae TaxID=2107226 RepID=A0ABD3FFK4_9STRA
MLTTDARITVLFTPKKVSASCSRSKLLATDSVVQIGQQRSLGTFVHRAEERISQWCLGSRHRRVLQLPSTRCRSTGLRRVVELLTKQQRQSMPSVVKMKDAVCKLPPGFCIANVAQDLIEHCVMLVVRGPTEPVMMYDDYNKKEDPPCNLEPLTHMEYLTKVYALHRVASPPLKHPKKSKKNEQQEESP